MSVPIIGIRVPACVRAVIPVRLRSAAVRSGTIINNLLSIYSIATGESIEDSVNRFQGLGYGDFKVQTAEAVIEMLRPVRERYEDISKNKDYIESVYKNGADIAGRVAGRTLDKVYKKIGFVAR